MLLETLSVCSKPGLGTALLGSRHSLASFTDIPPETKLLNITIDISLTHFDHQSDPGEADLDLQLALPLVYPQTVTIYQVDDDFNTGAGRETYLDIPTPMKTLLTRVVQSSSSMSNDEEQKCVFCVIWMGQRALAIQLYAPTV
jgi:hypothetical protein